MKLLKKPRRSDAASRPTTPSTARVCRPSPALRHRAERIVAAKIEFIPSPSFTERDAATKLLAPLEPVADLGETRAKPTGVAPYMASLYGTALLVPAAEAYLFRKMNFLKYRAAGLRKELDPERPRTELVNRIEADLAEANEIKNRLIRANLRLVVSVAKTFIESSTNLNELVSDGNLSLMRAVEKFDVDRGFKFSTYATYAIRRNFFRTIIQARKERQRFVSAEGELISLTSSGGNDQQLSISQFHQLKTWLAKLLDTLNPRERTIMSWRFGLQSNTEPRTLQDIAQSMGVCKERIRQLQTRAMLKLQKAAMSSQREVGDLL